MTKHCRVYMDYWGYGIEDFVPCEMCGRKAVDVHHIDGRGEGMDVISNLMGLCRYCHTKAHDKLNVTVVQILHDEFMKLNGW